jgi:hypothetical protein
MLCPYKVLRGPGSLVGIATGYGLDGARIESWWGGEIFRNCPDQPWGPPSLLYNGYRVFPGGKEWPGRDADPGAHTASCTMGTGSFLGVKSSQGVTLTPHPPLVPWSWKGRAIPLLPLWAIRSVQSLSACTGGALYLYLIM